MTPFVNALACLFALACAMFLWRDRSSLYRNALLIIGFLTLNMFFTYLGADTTDAKQMAQLEIFPFKMLGLCLCFSTTALQHKRRRYLVIAQVFWLWMELFGGVSLFYRGVDMHWIRIIAIAGIALGSSMLSRMSKEMEFCLMVFWIAIWIFF